MDERPAATMEYTIRLSNGTRLEVALAASTVRSVKEHLAKLQETDHCPVDRQRLIYKGRILEDDRNLADYGIPNQATLFLVRGGTGPNTTGTAMTTMSTSTTPSSAGGTTMSTTTSPSAQTGSPTSSVSSNVNLAVPGPLTIAGLPSGNNPMMSNPFVAMTRNGVGGGGAGGDSMMMNPLMPGSPEEMSQALNNPLFQGLLNNPEALRNMIQSQMQNNPTMQQLMSQDPTFQHLMNDPAAWQQVIQMIRNPEAMQQALRQHDLQLSQLENIPGGFNALSSMYEQYQQPLEESFMAPSNGAGTSAPQQPTAQQGLAGATGMAMPNPWGSSPGQQQQQRSVTSQPEGQTRPQFPSLRSLPLSGEPSQQLQQQDWRTHAGFPPLDDRISFNPWAVPTIGNPIPPVQPMMMGQPPPSLEQREQVMQMLDNPQIQSMMQTAFRQNPDFFRSAMMQQNPFFAAMVRDNPAMADQMIQQMLNPQTVRMMMQMEEQFRHFNVGQPQGASVAAPFGGLDFSNLLSGPGMQHQRNEQRRDHTPHNAITPADRYRYQLRSLYDLGFDDEQANLAALRRAHGNVNRAVDILLTASPPIPATTSGSSQTSNSGGGNNNNDDSIDDTSSSPTPMDMRESDRTDTVLVSPTTIPASNNSGGAGNDNETNHDPLSSPGAEKGEAPPKNADDKKND